ncbi:satratoxin biosynthesis SC1 cluster protein 4 [Colletotrichum spaethianum]|uniref:Satratoxin biosynthesis SC1 cluster protein 4 n=1 Tax=Colletotrichum spaethianum TaxID=700344 RepID=A0AA37LA11_9PEZI|nr:satratoxin biosynthesis SC1 cluster protein 4 [Colletotrichum spaethianum]GKT44581.1 satratoxin biosynthesis SC1 cluster protein 4 [Colletotrichum spaethianum]
MAFPGSEYMAEAPAGQGRFDAGTITSGALALGGTLTSLSIIFVGLRAYTRISLVGKAFGLDDYLIGISLGWAIIFFGLSIKLCDLGVGVHIWQVKRDDYSPAFLLHGLIVVVVYSLGVTTAKLSLLVLYLRLSPERWFRIVTMTFIGLATAYALTYLFLIVFSCRPTQASWDLSARPGAVCVDKNIVYMALSGTNIIMDIVCLILPLKIIIPLQMARRQKWSLILLFATGSFKDYTFDLEKQLNWASIELNAGVVCASVPALKPLFMHYLPMFVTSRIAGSKCNKSNPNYQNHLTTDPFSSTIENNKKRRNVQSEAYELHSRDDVSLSPSEMQRNGSNEDVAKLWSGDAFRKDCAGHRETIIESKHRDNDSSSIDSIGEIQPIPEGSSRPTPQRVKSMSIRVTTETRVEYEEP